LIAHILSFVVLIVQRSARTRYRKRERPDSRYSRTNPPDWTTQGLRTRILRALSKEPEP